MLASSKINKYMYEESLSLRQHFCALYSELFPGVSSYGWLTSQWEAESRQNDYRAVLIYNWALNNVGIRNTKPQAVKKLLITFDPQKLNY